MHGLGRDMATNSSRLQTEKSSTLQAERNTFEIRTCIVEHCQRKSSILQLGIYYNYDTWIAVRCQWKSEHGPQNVSILPR